MPYVTANDGARLHYEIHGTGSTNVILQHGMGSSEIWTPMINVTFSNLSATQTSAHLSLGAAGDYVLNLPRGQVSNRIWLHGLKLTWTETIP
jgi:hypothetical protein